MNKKKAGFTLLELMVAMGILAILVGLSIVGIQTVQRSLRNTQRNDVMNALNLKIQDIFTNTGSHPAIEFTTDSISVDEDGSGTFEADEVFYELSGAQQVNADETNQSGTAYCYVREVNEASYQLAVELEGGGWKQFGTSTTECTSVSY